MHELRILRIKLEQPLLISRKPEKIIVLGHKLPRSPAVRTIGRLRCVADVEVVVNAVTALIPPLENRSLLCRQPLIPRQRASNQILHCSRMPGFGRADEMRILNPQQLP